MAMRDAAPIPNRKPREKLNAPGGKSNATPALKCLAPVAITAADVRSVPAQKLRVIAAIDRIGRYRSAMFNTPTSTAMPMVPESVKSARRYRTYRAKPMYPDAISSGPLRMNCQMKRNAIRRPHVSRP
jgi:hypothetical protein